MALLYGMEHTNHDSDDPKFLGKNIFTNAFPLALANYIDRERGFQFRLCLQRSRMTAR